MLLPPGTASVTGGIFRRDVAAHAGETEGVANSGGREPSAANCCHRMPNGRRKRSWIGNSRSVGGFMRSPLPVCSIG